MIRKTLCLLVALLMVGCSSDSGNGDGIVNSEQIRLSGVLSLATDPSFEPAGSAARFASSPEDQVVVLALDTDGNSYATLTDQSGAFEFNRNIGIKSGTGYALAFIQLRTLDVLGSLVTNSGESALLTMDQDTELPELVLITQIKLTSSLGSGFAEDGETGAGYQLQASDLIDRDRDGAISRDEIFAVLVDSVQSGDIDSINSVSAFTLLGYRDTWVMTADIEDDAFEDDVCDWLAVDEGDAGYPVECSNEDDEDNPQIEFLTDSGEITVISGVKATSPEGVLENVVKVVQMNYLNRPYINEDSQFAAIIDESLLRDSGYASGPQAEHNLTAMDWGEAANEADLFWSPYYLDTLGAVPSQEYSPAMGLLAWAEYLYPDRQTGTLIAGQKALDIEANEFGLEWGDAYLPLNIPLNTPFQLTETETDEDNATLVESTVTYSVSLSFAHNADGSFALLEEGNGSGRILPVFQLRYAHPDEGENSCSYIVARFGAEGDDADENCDDSSDWAASLVDVRFGRIEHLGSSVTVVDSTPDLIKSNAVSAGGLPIDSTGNLSSEALDWVAYLYQNTANIDYQAEASQLTDLPDWGEQQGYLLWVKTSDTASALSPQPWPTVADTTKTVLIMGQTPGTVSVSNVVYSSPQSGVQFFLDLRAGAVESGDPQSLLENPVAAIASQVVDQATEQETTISLSASLSQLPPVDDARLGKTWLSSESVEGGAARSYEVGGATVWVIMDIDGDLDTDDDQLEVAVDSYLVINKPAP